MQHPLSTAYSISIIVGALSVTLSFSEPALNLETVQSCEEECQLQRSVKSAPARKQLSERKQSDGKKLNKIQFHSAPSLLYTSDCQNSRESASTLRKTSPYITSWTYSDSNCSLGVADEDFDAHYNSLLHEFLTEEPEDRKEVMLDRRASALYPSDKVGEHDTHDDDKVDKEVINHKQNRKAKKQYWWKPSWLVCVSSKI